MGKAKSSAVRRICFQLHKYTGLILGVLLSITGLSGSVLVFDRELDELLTPETTDFPPAESTASIDQALANARSAVNNGTDPTRIQMGRNPGAPHIVRFPTPQGAPGPVEASINPGTAEVLAVRTWGAYPVTWVYRLHYSFLDGESGEYLVGFLGLAMLLLSITGLVIWWPKIGQWLRALTISRRHGSYRLNHDLHKTTGFYFSVVLIVVAFSGVEMVFHEPVERVVDSVLPVAEYPSPRSSPEGKTLSTDRIVEIARGEFPDSRIYRVFLPGSETDPYRITFIQPEETWNEYGGTSVWVDQYSGQILDTWDSRNLPAGSALLEWLFPLHNGDALGLPGRVIVFLSGFLPALLFGTGVYLWWRKRRRGKAAAPQ